MKTILKTIRKNSERGQAIILIVFSLVGLVAIVGLMVDGGILLIEYARLKRGIDSASVAAASQYRKGFVGADLEKAGREFLKFNQSDATVTVYTCDYPNTSWDATLCPAANNGVARKLVRITARRYVTFGLMRAVGMNGTWIEATSVGEAASIDMVLFIDTSSSMAYETTGKDLDPNFATNCVVDATHPIPAECRDPLKTDRVSLAHPHGDDPDFCNSVARVAKVPSTDPGYAAYLTYLSQRCEPLGKVKDAAVDFVNQLFYPYDRVAVVSSTQQDGSAGSPATRKPQVMLTFNDNQAAVQTAIYNLKVFRPKNCPATADITSADLGPCLKTTPQYTNYQGQTCGALTGGGIDPTSCGASNIGGGLYLAGRQFGNGARTDSFWVAIALIGGPANAAVSPDAADPNTGWCPGSAGNPTWQWGTVNTGFCRDRDPSPYVLASNPRRKVNLTDPANPVYPSASTSLYDADDYARDAADYIAAPSPLGQSATLFAICLGEYCQNYYPQYNDPYSAEHLGQYMALNAGDQFNALGVRTSVANHGLYFCAECTNTSSSLEGVFTKIAENIFTRISK